MGTTGDLNAQKMKTVFLYFHIKKRQIPRLICSLKNGSLGVIWCMYTKEDDNLDFFCLWIFRSHLIPAQSATCSSYVEECSASNITVCIPHCPSTDNRFQNFFTTCLNLLFILRRNQRTMFHHQAIFHRPPNLSLRFWIVASKLAKISTQHHHCALMAVHEMRTSWTKMDERAALECTYSILVGGNAHPTYLVDGRKTHWKPKTPSIYCLLFKTTCQPKPKWWRGGKLGQRWILFEKQGSSRCPFFPL